MFIISNPWAASMELMAAVNLHVFLNILIKKEVDNIVQQISFFHDRYGLLLFKPCMDGKTGRTFNEFQLEFLLQSSSSV